MWEQILSSKFIAKAFAGFSAVLNYLHINISELNNIKLAALVLIISALIIFVLLIFIIILNNILSFFHRNNTSSRTDSFAAPSSDTPFNAEEQEELELELQKELEIALAQRNEMEQKKKQEQQKNSRSKQNHEKKLSSTDDSNDIFPNTHATDHFTDTVDFDWQKNSKSASVIADTPLDSSMLSYKQQASKLSELTGLLIDMIGRNIDDLKIAQTLNYKTQGLSNENDILKLIDAVKYFISLCRSEKFSHLDNAGELPKQAQALYHLANNDNSLALVLMENLMDKTIDKTANVSETKRKQIFSEVSDYACCLGALAEPDDLMLATSIYEMAVELNSNNATAWSRLGDVYRTANSESRAIWAYQNAYSFADSEINAAELANASQSISGYLYNQGNTLQAAKMHNIAKQYYDSLNINKRFTDKEIKAIEIIESNHKKNLPMTINKLLQKTR